VHMHFAARKSAGHATEGISKGESREAPTETAHCTKWADAAGVTRRQRRRLPLPAGGAKRSAVAEGDGHFRVAFALRSALQFADGSHGMRMLPAGIGYRRQSRTGAAWRDGTLVSAGRCEGAG